MKRTAILLAAVSIIFSSCCQSKVSDIRDFGAVGDGITVNTEAIQKAIDDAGAGTVVLIPEGTFLCGTVHLKNGIVLKLDKGAVLKGIDDYKQYEWYVADRDDLKKYDIGVGGPNEGGCYTPEWDRALIMGSGLKDISIVGEGTIDGSDVFNPLGEESMRGPHTVFLVDCDGVRMQDIHITSSANYAIMAFECTDLTFEGISIEGGWDGIHLRGAENVDIHDCDFKTGDDSIAGGYWKNMVVRNCNINSSCNGFRMFFPSEDLEVADCTFYGPGINHHRTTGRTQPLYGLIIEPGAWGPAPGSIGTIRIHDCEMSGLTAPVAVNLNNGNAASVLSIENIGIKDMLEGDKVIVMLSEKNFDTTEVSGIR